MKKLGVNGDGREHVVEIVGHASRQSSDGLHLLGFEQLLLQGDALADVLIKTEATHQFVIHA